MRYSNFWGRKSIFALATVFSFASLSTLCLGATIVIDDFSSPASPDVAVIGALSPNPESWSTNDAGILGGTRNVQMQVNGTPGPVSFIGTQGAGVFSFNGTTPGTAATISYPGLTNVDLTTMGDRFALDFLYVDNNVNDSLWIDIEVTDGANSAMYSAMVADSLTATTVTAPFASFTGDDVWGSADSITIHFNPNAYEHLDFELGGVGVAVPEPSIWMLVTTGLVGLMIVRRRRRQ